MTDCTRTTKEQVAEFLPAALNKAIVSYEAYYKSINHENGSTFTDYHKNAKVALAHIELLMKLAKWADVDVAPYQQDWRQFGTEALDECNQYHSENTLET